MAFSLRYRSPTGETRPWTLKEIIQGKPIDRPTHPMLVHFPIALYIAALGLDVVSRMAHLVQAPVAATWLILGGLIASIGTITTGLADRSSMRRGSKVRAVATRHMLLQLTATGVMVVDLVVRWSDRYQARAPWGWILLDLVAVGIITIGADIGGQLVFKIGVRVQSE